MPITKVDDVGEIMHLARSGRLIVKLSSAGVRKVKPGELLIDGSGRKVGRVVELLGPLSTPYASVIPMTDRTSRLVGSKVFSGGFSKCLATTRGALAGPVRVRFEVIRCR
jgi:rRNA processing protein Gar1